MARPGLEPFDISPLLVKGRPSGTVALLADCAHGKRKALGSSPGRALAIERNMTEHLSKNSY